MSYLREAYCVNRKSLAELLETVDDWTNIFQIPIARITNYHTCVLKKVPVIKLCKVRGLKSH